MIFRKIILTIAFAVNAFLAVGQNATIRGFVYDKQNAEPMIFTPVVLKGTTTGVSTDVNGYFLMSKIKPGNYTLHVSSLGYDTLKIPIEIKSDEIITKKFYLTKRSVELKAVDISAARQEAKTDVQISVTKITPKEIKQVATVGGDADIAQYLQVLPGVISSGDQGGQLYIRGGSPIQNKVLLDGMTVYNPFHSIGLFSVFDADIIRNADVYTGGFNAEYGGRISSIMDIKTRDGNKKHIGGKLTMSPFMAKIILEGPIVKETEEDKGSSSFIVSYKHSYLQHTSKKFYDYGTLKGQGIPYSFADLYAKTSFNSANGSKINVFGFNFTDSVNYQNVSNLGWRSYGFGSNFVIIPGTSPVLIDGNFSYSKYGINMTEPLQKPKESSISGFNMGLNFTYYLQKDELKYGIDLEAFSTTYTFYTPLNSEIKLDGSNTEAVGYLRYKMVINKLVFEPGIHLHYYAKLNEFSPEPRVGAKYNVTNKLRIKVAAGTYSQNFISASSDRDVVNLFYGFLTGPENIAGSNGEPVESKLQKSLHLIGGFEYDLPYNFDLNIEAYYKNFYQLTNINRFKTFEDTPTNASQPDELKKDFIVETGDAKGIDFTLKYDYKRLYFWATYSYAFVTRKQGDIEYPPHFDRRHNLSLVTAYTFGKGGNWEIDGRWNFGSGFPFTETQGVFPKLTFNDGFNTDYTKANGDIGLQYGKINEGRLPVYHRLDATLKRRIEVSKRVWLEANISVTNIYNRQNIFYKDRITGKEVYQLPILPSAGLSLNF